MSETRTEQAVAQLVEALTAEITEAAEALDRVGASLTELRRHVGWCGDTGAGLNGVRTALETHAATLRDEANAVRARMAPAESRSFPIAQYTDEGLASRIGVVRQEVA